jgi:hypothetical protein
MTRSDSWGLTLARVCIGAALAWCVAVALAAPELPRLAAVAALTTAALTVWRPWAGLPAVLACAPAGALLAPPPARAAELGAGAFLAAWQLRLGRPLTAERLPRRILVPMTLFGGAAVASWLAYVIRGAAGVTPSMLPSFLIRSLPQEYLALSTPEPHTWTMLQTLTGLAILLAAVAIAQPDRRAIGVVAKTLAVTAAVLAVATLADVGRQWATNDFGGWFLLRYVNGERFSLHLRDLNAAGSLYVLAGLIAAALAIFDRVHRLRWIALLAVMAPAMVLAGSRTSLVAGIAGIAVLAAAARRWTLTPRQRMTAAGAAAVVIVAAAVVADWRTDERGTAGRAVSLRSEFSQTTARMFASSPVFGVGVGQYFTRSNEFMSDDLRALYGNENAHNYFAQQFAELGTVGGLPFLWLAGAILARAWRAARVGGEIDPVAVGLFAGVAGYLLTCVTGHPLLVPEAALPFWIAAGAIVGAARDEGRRAAPYGVAVALVAAVLLIGLGRSIAVYTRTAERPRDLGFHEMEATDDGTPFRWVTQHGVTYVDDGAGFLRLRLRAPDLPRTRPLVVETWISGRVVDRRTLPVARWTTYDLGIREASGEPFRRIDLRVNQEWTEEVRLGRRAARRPISLMVGGITFIPLK